MEIEFIEKFVKDSFSRFPIEDQQDLINTAWIFFAENNITQVSELDKETLKKLKKRLTSDLYQVNWREVGIEDLRLESSNSGNLDISEDEKLSFVKEQSEQIDRVEIKQEVEKAMVAFESQKEELMFLLPPLLYEALYRKIAADAPINLTAGFEDQSLKILCRRALMRIQWISK